MTRSRLRRQRPRGSGFTLIEVLLVLVILVMLGSLVVGAYSRIQYNSNRKAAKIQIDSFSSNLEIYHQDVGHYPETLDGLLTEDGMGAGDPANWRGPYLNKVETLPTDPWGNAYQYEAEGNPPNDTFRIWSTGAAVDDENDDVTSWQQE